jgi:hypothetical protein
MGSPKAKKARDLFPGQRGSDHRPSQHGPVFTGRSAQFDGDHFWVKSEKKDIIIPKDKDDWEGLNFLAGKKLSWVNEQALKATAWPTGTAIYPISACL